MDSPCPKRRSEGTVAGLPDDALVEILSRLPVKLLCRSKCVSKAWCDLIADRLRCGNLPHTLEGFFYGDVEAHDDDYSSMSTDEPFSDYNSEEDRGFEVGEKGSGDDDYNSEEGRGFEVGEKGSGDDEKGCGDEENVSPHVNRHFLHLMERSVPLVDPSFSFLRKQPDFENIILLDSCNGLLLFGHSWDSDIYDTPGYIVCNPVTECWVQVPSSSLPSTALEESYSHDDDVWDTSVDTYLVFDPVVSSHFRLIELCCSRKVRAVRTYSSKTEGWRDRLNERKRWKKGGEWDLLRTITSMRGATVFHKMLHLIISPSRRGPELIAAVNGNGKTRRIFSWLENRGFPVFLGQSKGLLHCLSVSGHSDDSSSYMTELSIWVLEDYHAEQWNLKHTVSFSELFGRKSCQFGTDYNVASIHPDHNLVFFVQHWNYELISYDMDRKEVCALCNVGCDYGRVTPFAPYFSGSHVLSERC